MINYNVWTSYKFRYPFKGSETVSSTYSQAWQDIFVLSVLSGMKNGKYLEIGCNIPDYTNNTYLLSKDFGWRGISIDFLPTIEPAWRQQRPNDMLMIADALTVDYNSLLQNTPVIDYLQLDIDPCTNTYSVLTKLPHSSCRFKVITFETDYYSGLSGAKVREESRKIFSDLGYTLIVPDVLVHYNNGYHPFEDWYVDINLVNHEVANNIQRMAQHTSDPINLLFK